MSTSTASRSMKITFNAIMLVFFVLFCSYGVIGFMNITGAILPLTFTSILLLVFCYFFLLKKIISPIAELANSITTVAENDYKISSEKELGKTVKGCTLTLDAILTAARDKIFWYESLLDSIPWPISVTDMDMNWTFINKAAMDLTGATREEVLGKQCSSWGADICNTERCGIACLRRGQNTSFFTQPGLERDFQVDTAFLTDKSGQQIGHIEVVQDVTEMNKVKQKAERARQEGMFLAADQLDSIMQNLNESTEQLYRQVEEANNGAQTQSERIAETATAMDEMNATVLEVAKNASDAASNAESTRSKAQEGAEIVNDVTGAISDIEQRVQNMQQDVNGLGQQAEEIGQIMSVITDIADQTNLLALNAAIEAARAGEAGRGFAVVADEVRKLAEKTMSATEEVGNSITSIQNGARNNISNIDQVVGVVTQGATLAQDSGKVLDSIVSLAEGTSLQVSAIATASTEQSAANDEIARHTEEINRISSETSASMSQATTDLSQFVQNVEKLQQIIEGLRKA